ncbi:hypothetical protein [Longimicrobium sp.]|uniref:Ig-like domain-containing protein n=1 Tax=Longimicrobium sp. TaxID=2029185 RepID=UPI002E359DA4|nr:hypothetical protein [Longimicrobium sp.]HEX6041525.1 hypothetical protein [Longimicrobium sp.]
MKPHTFRRGGMAAAALLALAAAACEDSTGSPTPAERARALRTLVEVGQGSPDRILRAGYAVPVVARVTDEINRPVAGAPVVWTGPAGGGSVAPATAQTNADGLVSGTWTTGTRAGLQELVAAVEGNENVFDRTLMVVFADTVVGTLVIDALRDSITRGDTTRVLVTDARDRYGNPYVLAGTQPDNPPPIEFTSLNPSVATLVSTTARGALVTGVGAGTARIVARSDGKADTVSVVVVNPPAGSRARP